jgi:flagellar hook-length control protein FliK
MIRLRLAPGDMGSVRVEMKVQNRNVQARVVAETEAASSSLREHLPELKARLESFGMQVEKIEVEVESESLHQNSFFNHDSGNQQDKAGDQWRRQGRENSRPSQADTERVSPAVSPDVMRTAEFASAGVDIRL